MLFHVNISFKDSEPNNFQPFFHLLIEQDLARQKPDFRENQSNNKKKTLRINICCCFRCNSSSITLYAMLTSDGNVP